MKLIETLIDLIVEAAPEEIYKKYYSDIERPTFLRVISLDPATSVDNDEEGGIKKIGKYSKLLLKMFKEGNLKSEDFPKAKDYLSLVYKHKVPVDLNKVKTLGDLFNLVEKYYSQDGTKNVFDLLNLLDKNEYELRKSGEKWVIYTPKSEKAAAYLGTGTEWCTAWGPYSTNERYRDRNNHFSSHNGRGPLYVMINRNDPTDKYQFHFETKQFMDKNDRKINTGDFFDEQEDVTEYFFPSLYDSSIEVSTEETDRMNFLSSSKTTMLVERIIGESNNPITQILINEEDDDLVEGMKRYINDDNLSSLTYDYRGKVLEFQLGDVSDSTLYQVSETSNAYRYDSDPYADHSEYLRNDIRDMGDDNWYEENIGSLLKQYFDEEVSLPGVNTYEQFRELFQDYWEKLIDDYADEYAYLNEGTVTSAADTELNNIEKFISVNDRFIGIWPAQMALFIEREKITELTDLESFFSAYCEYHGLDYEYENPMYNVNMEYPKLKDMGSHFEGYTKKIQEELEQTPECMENKEKLIQIRKKFFGGGNSFRKDDLRIELKGGYDCDENGVNVIIDYMEKNPNNPDVSNWKRWGGFMDVDRMVEYITNERLFESKKKIS
jgi:hypothetical protein